MRIYGSLLQTSETKKAENETENIVGSKLLHLCPAKFRITYPTEFYCILIFLFYCTSIYCCYVFIFERVHLTRAFLYWRYGFHFMFCCRQSYPLKCIFLSYNYLHFRRLLHLCHGHCSIDFVSACYFSCIYMRKRKFEYETESLVFVITIFQKKELFWSQNTHLNLALWLENIFFSCELIIILVRKKNEQKSAFIQIKRKMSNKSFLSPFN